ncbi:MAG: transketolase [Sneathiella sp.]|nr:transketolase [Sneathiella sp.]
MTRVALFAHMQGVTISDPLDQLCINTVRFLSVDTLQQANSGHSCMPFGAAAMAYVISE